jgi:TATA-box binding protein (TBP) (component of TFIID and TFIIIB)
MSARSLSKKLLKRQYSTKKSKKGQVAKPKTKHTSTRTFETRSTVLYQTCNPLPPSMDPPALWLALATINGQRAKHGAQAVPIPFLEPTPQLADSPGLSHLETNRVMSRFLEQDHDAIPVDKDVLDRLNFGVRNLVVWIDILKNLTPILSRIFCVSQERTQFLSLKLWSRSPKASVGIFDTESALVNGSDNLADVVLTLYLVLFRLWMATGILPNFSRVRTVNVTLSTKMHQQIDLDLLLYRLKKANTSFKINYCKTGKSKFPGLSIVDTCSSSKSSKGEKRRLSMKVFSYADLTLVGWASILDAYLRSTSMRQLGATVLDFAQRDPDEDRDTDTEMST